VCHETPTHPFTKAFTIFGTRAGCNQLIYYIVTYVARARHK